MRNAPIHQRSRIPGWISPGLLLSIYQGMVAYWPMVMENGIYKDYTGRGNDLTPAVRNGLQGNGFVNQASYITRADNIDLSIGGGETFTLSLWVCPYNATAACLISKNASGTNRSYRIAYSYASSDKKIYAFIFNNGGTSAEVDSTALTLNAWNWILFYWNPITTTLGVSLNNGADVTASYVGAVADCTSNFTIGRLDENNAQLLQGAIDEVCVWKRMLTTDERSYLYNSGSGVDLRSANQK